MRAKEHFLILDLLRGVAALVVLSFHWFDGQGKDWLASACMAVDFFFLLSGFVIAHAYDARLSTTMTIATFLRVRFIRLYPMIALGTLVGLVRILLHDTVKQTVAPFSHYAFGVGTELLLLPDLLNKVGDKAIFLIDGPVWSLFFEIFANLIYVFFFRQLANRFVLGGLVLLSAIALVFSAFATPKGLNVGWSSATFILGFPRILFSFFAGVALYRLRSAGHSLPFSAGPIVLSVVLVILISQPRGSLPAGAQLAVLLVVFPLMVLLGAGRQLDGRWASSATWLGNISYPLYVLHAPLLWMLTGTLKYSSEYEKTSIFVSGGAAFVLVMIASWITLTYYDEPIRRWLTSRLIARRKTVTALSQ